MTGSAQRESRDSGAITHMHTSGKVRGTVRIAPAVLIQLIELTVQGVKGFGELRPLRSQEPDKPETEARTYSNGKVAVTVIDDQIDTAVALAIHHGVNVAELTDEIRRRIGFAGANMLGMTVRTVDIYIDEIMPDPSGS